MNYLSCPCKPICLTPQAVSQQLGINLAGFWNHSRLEVGECASLTSPQAIWDLALRTRTVNCGSRGGSLTWNLVRTLSMCINCGLPEPVHDQREKVPRGTWAEGLSWFGLCLGYNTPIYWKDPQFLKWPWISKWLRRHYVAGPVSIHLISCESASGNEGATVFQASSSAGLPKSARVYTKLMAWLSDPCCLKGLLVFGWDCQCGLSGWRPLWGRQPALMVYIRQSLSRPTTTQSQRRFCDQ